MTRKLSGVVAAAWSVVVLASLAAAAGDLELGGGERKGGERAPVGEGEAPGGATVATPVVVTSSYLSGGVPRRASKRVPVRSLGGGEVGSHAGRFQVWEGTATCLGCHPNQGLEVHGSVHYQWRGDASATVGLSGQEAGKLGGINDFCIYPDINWIGRMTNLDGVTVDGGCALCHAGLGLKPAPDPTDEQLGNIDCLVCHSAPYRRTVARIGDQLRLVPDEMRMGMTALEAAWRIERPTSGICLNCHARAGGGNNFKRGDIEEAHRDPSVAVDVHMAPASAGGAGLACLDCHTAANHRIAGRGSDLRPLDSHDPVRCTNCHPSAPHGDSRLNRHTARVDCTTCHIPRFAKAAATDMHRDWSAPGDIDPVKRLYEPHHTAATNVVPQYRFWNGTSSFYQFGDPAVPGPSGRIVMSEPVGTVGSPGARIFPFKRHTALQPIDPATRVLLPLKIGVFFQTGAVDAAVEQGVAAVGWQDRGHEFAETERWMGIFHEVAPKEQALSCASCHPAAGRLDFAALGYTPLATRNGKPLCQSCHGRKELGFYDVHRKHVDSERIDCSGCHSFSAAS